MVFSIIVGWIMTRIILILLYFILVTPIGLLFRLFGKQFLDLRGDENQKSYWDLRIEEEKTKNRYENQF